MLNSKKMNKYALTRKEFAGLAPEDFVSNYISHIARAEFSRSLLSKALLHNLQFV